MHVMMSSCATAAPGSKSTATIQHNATTSSSIQQQQHQQKHSQNHTTSSQATAYHTSITLTNNNSSNTKSAAKQSEHMEHSSSSQYHGKKNFFTKAVPTMPRPLAILCLILNIVLPGLGTLVSSFAVVFGASHSYDSMTRAFFVNLLAFALQLGSAIIILGWVWSIKYGFLFVQLSDNDTSNGGENVPDLPLMYRARHNSIESTNQFNVKPKMKLSNTIAAVVSEEEE